ncbi:MAG: sigma 54-interacting transcriptional regulator [Candidatus Fermentithermobacillus carboniphilus]|uniref:Sigma 54-interacting transcriptional regulator n=1 Tax=Candidatus Fermentithermobacillus carboniphilus TaxID=3085328 RepID=A0AAT9LAS6_9FIRM|nr:MAG: sigma 54-interacting transcriptional regulator [Candidatus Fermentithermobacillus carboniphilus]
MSYLSEVGGVAQEVCDAIASVLGVDVEIVDDMLVRIAGTGKYRSRVGWFLGSEGVVYKHVLRTGKGALLANPGKEAICSMCSRAGNCEETAELSSPIIVDGRTVGVIGLVCFDQEQRDRLLSRIDSHKEFIGHMAGLLAAKAVESHMWMEKKLAAEIIMLLLDRIDEAVIAVDHLGKPIYLNRRARKTFEIPNSASPLEDHPESKPFRAAMAVLRDALSSGKRYSQSEIFMDTGTGEQGFMVSTSVLSDGGKNLGAIASFRPVSELHRWAYDLTHGSAGAVFGVDSLIGQSRSIAELKEIALKVAKSPSTVLIRGESGTGKELLARAIHSASDRKDKPFVAVNCAAIPDGLLESELFGYEEGAFTGARKGGKPGKFEIADGGTLFLDEIGDMSLHLQSKLLRVLQERQVERLGSNKPRRCDVRIIAATNQDLERKMQNGEFRDDLYFRLSVIPIYIPPLRERPEDVEPLVRHFVRKYAEIMGKKIDDVEPSALELLKSYSWPGNVRELENAIEYAVNFETKEILTVKSLPARIRSCGNAQEKGFASGLRIEGRVSGIKAAEIDLIRQALKKYGTSYEGKKRAARELGIGIATLYRKISRYRIEVSN